VNTEDDNEYRYKRFTTSLLLRDLRFRKSAAYTDTAFADRGENGISVPNRLFGFNVLGQFSA